MLALPFYEYVTSPYVITVTLNQKRLSRDCSSQVNSTQTLGGINRWAIGHIDVNIVQRRFRILYKVIRIEIMLYEYIKYEYLSQGYAKILYGGV